MFTLSLFVIAVRFSVGKLSKSSYIPHFSRSGCDTQALSVYLFKPITHTNTLECVCICNPSLSYGYFAYLD